MMTTVDKRTPLFYVRRSVGAILLVALAAVFFYSGWSKIHSDNAFDAFQWTFLDLGISSFTMAGIIARLMIGFEFLLGVFLLCHIYLRSFTYPAIIITLLVFIGYLSLLLIQQGNNGNCGCFGDKIAMKPLAAIWKNVAMIAATIALIYLYPIKPYRQQEWIAAVVGMAALVAPFIMNPLDAGNEPKQMSQAINLNPLYAATPAPSVELRKGKHIVALMSLSCPHCKKAAFLLQIIHQQHPDIPIFMVLNGSDKYKASFFEETHAEKVPHVIFTNTDAFIDMAGPSVPTIYWINNSMIEKQSNYYQLDPSYMQTWLKQ